MMSKKKSIKVSEEKIATYVETPESTSKTVWETVGHAVIRFIEPKPNNDWFTAKDVIAGILTEVNFGLITQEKIEEIASDVLTLLTANHLLVKNEDKYRKFTMDEIVPDGRIAIQRKDD